MSSLQRFRIQESEEKGVLFHVNFAFFGIFGMEHLKQQMPNISKFDEF